MADDKIRMSITRAEAADRLEQIAASVAQWFGFVGWT